MGVGGHSQAMRTWALRLLVVPAELQATHWHQKSSGPKSSSTCCRVISMLASRTTRPAGGRGGGDTEREELISAFCLMSQVKEFSSLHLLL